ncbi:hypothetical protein FIBSPDRAFT_941499 [Athelia psychrophila]|uniref:Uncharacterized protein n=1 Tax=Athelia psychrophila TaxID=1759441 RepID=A0A167U138_9AGAM|nr:hypothetical protein FIBSPDRAFT_941499 [Fibularhizoctonia sp. CBS 109695]
MSPSTAVAGMRIWRWRWKWGSFERAVLVAEVANPTPYNACTPGFRILALLPNIIPIILGRATRLKRPDPHRRLKTANHGQLHAATFHPVDASTKAVAHGVAVLSPLEFAPLPEAGASVEKSFQAPSLDARQRDAREPRERAFASGCVHRVRPGAAIPACPRATGSQNAPLPAWKMLGDGADDEVDGGNAQVVLTRGQRWEGSVDRA